MLSYLPLAHVAERMVVQNQSTYYGFQVFFAESIDTFVDDLRRARPTIFFSVPRLWTKFQLAVHAKLPQKKQDVLFRDPDRRANASNERSSSSSASRTCASRFTGAAPLAAAHHRLVPRISGSSCSRRTG